MRNKPKKKAEEKYGVGFFLVGLASLSATSAFLSALVFLKPCLRLLQRVHIKLIPWFFPFA